MNILHIIRKNNTLHFLDVLVILLAIIALGVFLYMRVSRKTEWVRVSIKIQPNNIWWSEQPKPWYTASFVTNDIAYDSFGKKVAEISDIHTIELVDGKVDTIVEVSLKTLVTAQKKQYMFNHQPLLVGKPIEIPFQHTVVSGIVTNIGASYRYIDKTIETRLVAEFPWVVDHLVVGKQATDQTGKVIAEILDVKAQNASSYDFIDAWERRFFISTNDPYRKDAILTLRIKALEYNGQHYSLNGTPLRVGSEFQIQFSDVAVNYSLISKIYDN